MFDLIRKYKREFVYSSYLFLVFELLVSPQLIPDIRLYTAVVVVGFLIVSSWVLGTFLRYSKKKIIKYSDIRLKIAFKSRFYTQVLMPLIFYSAIVLFLLYNHTVYLNQIVITVSVVLFFNLFLNVRVSYSKIYSVERLTRLVYDFMGIVLFYIVAIVVYRMGLGLITNVLVLFFLSLAIFMYTLIIHRKESVRGALIAFASSLFIVFVAYLTHKQNIFLQPSIIAVSFYLVVSIWNIRFAGYRKLVEYLPPIMYSLMSIILILSV